MSASPKTLIEIGFVRLKAEALHPPVGYGVPEQGAILKGHSGDKALRWFGRVWAAITSGGRISGGAVERDPCPQLA
jgi:hypothetical protein